MPAPYDIDFDAGKDRSPYGKRQFFDFVGGFEPGTGNYRIGTALIRLKKLRL